MLALADPLGRRTGHGFLCHRLTVVVLIGLALVWHAHNVTAATQDRSQADRARVNLDLVEAAGKGNVQAVRTLLSDGADVNAKNTFGTTALMAAADRGDLEVVKAILAAGADVNAKNHYGLTDPDESGKVVELLKSRGAKGSKAGGGYEKLGIEFKEHWGNGREGSRIYPQAE